MSDDSNVIVSPSGAVVVPPWVPNAPTITAPFMATVPEVLVNVALLGTPGHGNWVSTQRGTGRPCAQCSIRPHPSLPYTHNVGASAITPMTSKRSNPEELEIHRIHPKVIPRERAGFCRNRVATQSPLPNGSMVTIMQPIHRNPRGRKLSL